MCIDWSVASGPIYTQNEFYIFPSVVGSDT